MENRKTQITDLALKLIREKGYVAISYDDLSKQLGVTKASIHYHFEKKEDLGVAVTERLLQNLQDFSSLITNSKMTVEEKINHFLERQIVLSDGGICPISSLQSDIESLPEKIRQNVEEISQLEITIFKNILKETMNERRVEEIESLAFAIVSCMKGAIQYERVLGKKILPQAMNEINRLIKG
ncbi:TetR/AcrR family transcriptional regulator [Gottfriedia acidiceleris]|uniref:TetR/AcrR family transcriptional regulator n=1 Tax=Bacillaceae TaxID=186817 RepID=UPI000BEBE38A|nr:MULTISPECIES: TetR/AcrR family transcriptional regulator [unclassified Bacillus (in: firmicutes)]PEC49032.1 TetR family transcriptional regulator [Bacillus sp. AFS096315]PFM74701.1 TetR family transcriptional regulator [Bacillus sp. AFS077874]